MITKFSKQFIQNMVNEKVAEPRILRNYDIIVDRNRGLSVGQLCIKYAMSKSQILRIINENK